MKPVRSLYIVLMAGAALLGACQTVSASPAASTQSAAAMPEALASPVYTAAIESLKAQPAVKAAFTEIESHRAENVKTLIELTEIPAPPFGEDARGQRVAELFREAGLTDVRIDEVGNVIARRPGKTGNKNIALVAHIDTVFPIETDLTVRQDGDTYYAPGIGDNSRGVIVMLSMIKAMEAHNIQTDGDLLFIGNVGEEGLGDLRGVKHLYRPGAPKIDGMIAIDGGGMNRLIYGGVGSARYRISFKGPGGHSWGAFGLANPHHALARAVNLFAERAPQVTNTGPKSSFSVGRIGGGTSINSIAFESWMEVDMRSGDVGKLADVDAVFQQAIADGLAAENKARKDGPPLIVDIEKVGDRPAGTAPLDQPLIQQAMAAMQSMDISPRLSISSTDANIPISLGQPAITISRGGVSKKAHSLDESWQDVDSHIAIQIALLIALAQAGYAAP